MLKYTGDGFLPDIPARDLTDEEVAKYGGEKFLIASGLYSKVKQSDKRLEDDKDGEE